MSEFRLYFRYIRTLLKGELQYKGWWIKVLLVLFTMATDPLEVLLLFDRFGSIGAWSPSRVMLMYGTAVCCFGLAETFGRGFDYFPQLIKSGDFDRILLRPRSLYVQTAAARFHLHRLSRVVGGFALMGITLRAQGAVFSAQNAAMLLAALLGGTLLYIGIFMLTAAMTFFTVEGMQLTYIFTNGSYQVAKAPPVYLPNWLRRLFLYIVPMLAFCWLPVSAVCGWGTSYALGWIALPAGAAFFAASYIVWNLCSRRYRSTGS